MQQYMIKTEQINKGVVSLDKDDLHHIFIVMRRTDIDLIICAEYITGYKYLCKIENNEIKMVEVFTEDNEFKNELVLAFSLCKSDKFEMVIQKACELGVTKFIPVVTERSSIKITSDKLDKKMKRWHKIIKEASEQAHRNTLMEITCPCSIDELIEHSNLVNVSIVAYEKASIDDKIDDHVEIGLSHLILIGPEGGFSDNEITKLDDNFFNIVSLGKRILRMETAAIVACGLIGNILEGSY
jgi:16S rRNA (uracil1498-N3)-methyltransferase